jgi:cytochrome P450
MIKPPGPRGREVLGFFGVKYAPHSLGFLEQTARRYGPISYFRLIRQHTYLLNDAELIKEVLITQQHHFARDFGATILKELIGDGLITREEPLHRERRRVLQPAFHREQVASYVDIIVGESVRALHSWHGRASVNVGEEMRLLTLSIIGSSLFGPEFRESARAISDVLQRVRKRMRSIIVAATIFKPVIRRYRRAFPESRSLFFPKERVDLHRILQPLIDQRQRSGAKDVLSLLLAQQDSADGSLTDEDIRNEMVTFVLAGHETTATALTWVCYLLSTHPHVQERLAEEARIVLDGREPTMDDIPRLTYASAVFNETLRLFPPAGIFGRRALQKTTLGGYDIPQGATVLLSPYIIQRNERYFENPEAFVPERWETSTPPKFSFFPFGGGAKMCIGEPMARTEGVLILAEIARRFQLLRTSDRKIGINPRITVVPDQPVILALRPRERPATHQLNKANLLDEIVSSS